MSNAFRSFGETGCRSDSAIYFILTMVGGLTYTLFSLLLITDGSYLKTGNRFIKLSPLLAAFLLLLSVKCIWSPLRLGNKMDLCKLASEILPGLGKRLILLFGLLSGNSNCIGKAICPFEVGQKDKVLKPKKD